MNKLYIFVLLSIFLTACGGGGGGGGEGGAKNVTAVPPPVPALPTPEPSLPEPALPVPSQPTVTEFSLKESEPREEGLLIQSEAKSSREIVVPDGFTLNSERSFNLRIALSENDTQAAYLSICSDYEQHSDSSYSINYDSCLLRASLNDSTYEAIITVTNDTTGLVAAIWFMDENKEPIITDWTF
jgi:hypothetical protein